MSALMRRPFSREQRLTIIQVLQLWLLSATMNAWLGGDDSSVWPAAGASAACLALNAGLYLYLVRMERMRKGRL